MKVASAVLILAAAAPLLPLVHAAGNSQNCIIGGINPNLDYYPDKATPFNISQTSLRLDYYNTYKTITNKVDGQVVVMYPCGSTAPNVTGASVTIPVPIRSVDIEDTSVITFLEAIGVRSTIKFSSVTSTTTSPCLQQMLASGTLQSTSAANSSLKISQLQALDAVFSTSQVTNTGWAANTVLFSAASDVGALQRIEWINVVGMLYNLEFVAQAAGKSIISNYQRMSANARTYASGSKTSLTIAFVTTYKGQYTVSGAQQFKDYASDLGLKYLAPAVYSSPSSFSAAAASVDILIDLSSYGIGGATATSFNNFYGLQGSTLKFITNNRVYSPDKTGPYGGGSDWFESAVLEQNVVLADLIAICYPAIAPTGYSPRYFRNVLSGESQVVTQASSCTNVNATLTVPNILPAIVTSLSQQSSPGLLLVILSVVVCIMTHRLA
ncbi:uncharacterized protein BJ171DRAFT_565456 [Polychytrium aggregatum]|uniref:uncharacterized protein n=1 Tax=Polychytrium aggregatum TaxID=110093 RepID=UPI0022FE2FA1|nr:uncharacterized protein BJ171DRAFT_565456 [Polychytrium aggregatum]KAI9208334.1 hypothetical protein BJ171DRAFT_565456 [Polychytrium aggregatum]